MRQAFKAYLIAYIQWLLFLFRELIMRPLPLLVCWPTLWGGAENFFKIPLNGSRAPAGEISEFLHRQVEHEIPFHVVNQVYFARLLEIGKHIILINLAFSYRAPRHCLPHKTHRRQHL